MLKNVVCDLGDMIRYRETGKFFQAISSCSNARKDIVRIREMLDRMETFVK